MKFNRIMVDGTGAEFHVVAELDKTKISNVIANLAQRARDTKSKKVTALDGAFTVTIVDIQAAPRGGSL